MKKELVILLAIALAATIVSADFLVGDGSNNKVIRRYNDNGTQDWSNSNGRSTSNITLNNAGDLAFIARQGTDKMLTTISTGGSYYDDRYKAGTNIVDAEWLDIDLDDDDRVELVVTGRNEMYIVSVDDTDITDVSYTTLASYTVSDTDGSNGTGGYLLLGDDYNDDGVRDIIATKGGNDSGNRINIWDPTDGSRIASYSASQCRGIRDAIFGPDENGDGAEDLWIADHYRDEIRAYDANGTYIGIVDLGISFENPTDIAESIDDRVYISTRFGTSLSAGGLGSTYGNVIEYNPYTDTTSLILDTSGGRWDAVEYINVPDIWSTSFESSSMSPFSLDNCCGNYVAYMNWGSGAKDGSKVAKFQWWEDNYDGTRSARGIEAQSRTNGLKINEEGWYGFSFLIPTGSETFPLDTSIGIAQALAHGPDTCPITWTWILNTDPNGLILTHRIGSGTNQTDATLLETIPTQQWIDVIIHMKWSNNWTGQMEVWVGDDCLGPKPAPSYSAYDIRVGCDCWDEDSLETGTHVKFGMYCHDVDDYVDGEKRTIYFDNVSAMEGGPADGWYQVNPNISH